MAFNFLKSLDADDIFISYAREDGEAYLTGLDAALSARGFSCFTDKRGTDANPLPPETLFRKIRLCKTLVLLGTPGALRKPENIAPELREFADANGTSRIIVISFDRSPDHDTGLADWSKTPWYALVEGKSREREDPKALVTGKPSDSIITNIATASNYMKSKDRLLRYRNRALTLLAGLVFAIVAAGGVAWYQLSRAAAATKKAEEETAKAEQAGENARKALAQAETARGEAQTARAEAETAKTDATKQKDIADIATKDAEAKTKLADDATRKALAAENRATTAQARAEHQQAIADSRSLANSSQTLLRQRPLEVPRSLSRAVDAMKKSTSVGLHAVEADTALRESLALFPRLRNSYAYAEGEALGAVRAATLSPDGRHFALISKDDKLRVYESGSRTPQVFDCKCSDVALNSGASLAAVVMKEGGIEIFDLKANRSRPLPAGADVFPEHLALSPGGRYLALSTNLGEDIGIHSSVSVLEVASGKVIKTFDDYIDTPGDKETDASGDAGADEETKAVASGAYVNLNMLINDVAFGPSGNLAVGGKYNTPQGGRFTGRIVFWSLSEQASNGEAEPELTGASFDNPEIIPQEQGALAVAPGTDNTYFATESGVWKRLSGQTGYEPVARLPYPLTPPFTAHIKKVAFGPDGKSLTLVRDVKGDQHSKDNDKGVLEMWDATGHRELARAFQSKEVTDVAFKPGGQFVAAMNGQPTNDEPARVFRAADAEEADSIVFEPETEEKEVKDASPNADFIINADDKVAVVWDVWGKRKMTVTLDDTLQEVEDAAISPGGKFFALSGRDKKGEESIVVYRSGGDSYSRWKSIPNKVEGSIGMMSLSADGQRLAVLYSHSCRFVRVWDVGNARDVSPDVLTDCDGPVKKGSSFIYEVTRMRLSPNGRFLVMTDIDHKTQLLDLSKGRTTKLIPLLDATVIRSLAFSPDERYLGLGSEEGILHVFDTRTAEGVTEVARLQHTGEVTAVAFSDDDKYVATASSDPHPYHLNEEESYPLRVWLLQPAELIREAKQRMQSVSQPKQ